jgi:hypothetical protein
LPLNCAHRFDKPLWRSFSGVESRASTLIIRFCSSAWRRRKLLTVNIAHVAGRLLA